MRFFVLAFLVACGPATAELEETTPPGTTSPTTDPGTTPPTMDPTTPTAPVPVDWFLSGDLVIPPDAEVPEGVVRVGLFDASELGCCEVWTSIEVGAVEPGDIVPFEIPAWDLPPKDTYVTDPYAPEMELAAFAVGAWVDVDGDGQPGPDDHYVAATLDYLAHIRGVVSSDAAGSGAALGWNHVQVFEEVVTPFSGDRVLSDVDALLLPQPPPGPLTATIAEELAGGSSGDRRVDLFSANEFLGIPVADPVLLSAEAPSSGFGETVTFDALPDPPEDHFTDDLGDGEIVGAELAVYAAVAYVDEDGDKTWDFFEPVLAATDGPPPQDQTTLVYARATGFQARWIALYLGGMGWAITADDPYDPYDPVVGPWGAGLLLSGG